MDANTLKAAAVELNGRTLYPELEQSFAPFASELQAMAQTIRTVTADLPFHTEPGLNLAARFNHAWYGGNEC